MISRRSIPEFPARDGSVQSLIVHASSGLVVVMVNLVMSGLDDGLKASPGHKDEKTPIEPFFTLFTIWY